jgi:DNA-binding IclR family transcriptional regulator
MAGNSNEAGRSVLSRCFAILDCFGPETPDLTLSMIAQQAGLSSSTAHRLLGELTEWGALARDPETGRYTVGRRLWRIGNAAPRERKLRDVAMPYMEDLLEATHQIVHLVIIDEGKALYLEKLATREAPDVLTGVGRYLPLHATGPGRVIAAFSSPTFIESVLSGDLVAQTSATLTDPRDLRRSFASIRQTGYCISRDEVIFGASSVAAPIRDRTGAVIASLSVVVPSTTPSLQALVAPVRLACLGISRDLGHRPRQGQGYTAVPQVG